MAIQHFNEPGASRDCFLADGLLTKIIRMPFRFIDAAGLRLPRWLVNDACIECVLSRTKALQCPPNPAS